MQVTSLNVSSFFRVSVSWNIRNFLGVDFFYFLSLDWKVWGSISRNIRNTFFWENIKKKISEWILLGKNERNFLREKFWWLRLEFQSVEFHFWKYKNYFNIRPGKFHFLKYKELVSGWIFFFWEEEEEGGLGLGSKGFLFWKYKKRFFLRKYKNFFNIRARKFHFAKYIEFFGS